MLFKFSLRMKAMFAVMSQVPASSLSSVTTSFGQVSCCPAFTATPLPAEQKGTSYRTELTRNVFILSFFGVHTDGFVRNYINLHWILIVLQLLTPVQSKQQTGASTQSAT